MLGEHKWVGRSLVLVAAIIACLNTGARGGIQEQMNQLDIDTAGLQDVLNIFGDDVSYRLGEEYFEPDEVPRPSYCIDYNNGFMVYMKENWVIECRFELISLGYRWRESIEVGTSLDYVLNIVGLPKRTVVGQPNGWEDGVLYKDIEGTVGRCYYRRSDQNVRFFFSNYKVSALYVTRSDYSTFYPPEEVTTVQPYDDVRSKDLRQVDLSTQPGLLETLTFNIDTYWPTATMMPPGEDPWIMMEAARNPGLGVRGLHQRDITGAGINVGIIDQPIRLDHPEYEGKIAAYYDTGCGGETSSMHGPAVTSLLVGEYCGTAPGARVYYAAAPSWLADAAYYADGLNWIIAQNETLPPGEKIRVVSVSAAPSGPGSPFDYNNEQWDTACDAATAAGILVLDCTSHRGVIGSCWADPNAPEDVTRCTPGFPGYEPWFYETDILVPSSLRTTAECYADGPISYIYWGDGGLSWSIPYCAGVLALGWQMEPSLSGECMLAKLFGAGYISPAGARFIDPPAFIAGLEGLADINGDNRVNLCDLARITQHWYEAAGPEQGDLNGDGQVDMADLLLLSQKWLWQPE